MPRKRQRSPKEILQLVQEAWDWDKAHGANEHETSEWEEDFEAKASTLRKAFEQTIPEDLYIELFGSLDKPCQLLLNKESNASANSFYDLESYILEYDHVFLYNQLFKNMIVDFKTGERKWYPKTYEALIGFRGFVLDVDHVNEHNIFSVIAKITSAPILPNYINLTGNGLHLYFLLDATHDFEHSVSLMKKVNRTSIEAERDIYIALKQKMIAWFNGLAVKSDTDNHLAQPSRLAGSKTKNRNKRTILFKVSDTKYSIQHIAELVGIELPDEESIRHWKKKVTADRRAWKKTQMKMDHKPATLLNFVDGDELEAVVIVPIIEDEGNPTRDEVDSSNSKFRFEFEGLAQRVLEDCDWPKDSPEAEFFEKQRRLRAEKAASSENQNLKIAQRRGLESQYNQFLQYCYDVAAYGKRRKVLHIFWNHAPWYKQDAGVILRDFDDLFLHCNSLHRTDKLTKQHYKSIVNGRPYQYTKDEISRLLGVELKFKNKKQEESQRNREAKDHKWKRIYVICETLLEENPRRSWVALTNVLKSYGEQVDEKTLRSRPEIRELKSRLRSR